MAPSTGESTKATRAVTETSRLKSDSASRFRPNTPTPPGGTISEAKRAGRTTASVVVVYAEFAQSYIAHPKMVRRSLRIALEPSVVPRPMRRSG